MVGKLLKNPLLDYDKIVQADVDSRKDLLGYVTWPLIEYKGKNVGNHML